MLQKNKQKSIEYWNNSASSWKYKAYSPDKNYTSFPSSLVRNEIVINELLKIKNKNIRILDVGCADGGLISEMVKNGFTNVVGIDNSPEMIKQAKIDFKENFPDIDCEKMFLLKDADDDFFNETFDVITAIGLIEYVKDLDLFFYKLRKIMNENSIALIESRNKLFNLFSANQYTINDSQNIKNLVDELDSIKHLSPNQNQAEAVLSSIHILSQKLKDFDVSREIKEKQFQEYPFELAQYSPKELMEIVGKENFNLNEIFYYHTHLFPPRFGKDFSQLYNLIGVLLQPLGNTPLGALICSAYVAKIKLIN
ncbi:methyltransferase domain-containing protein [Alphaproteobacteria bacterium]|nr:methyltransferase domain-containing protein [Alphaproteobacteria bacterium]